MALNAYLKLKGARTGDIFGSVMQRGREHKIMVIAVSHEIISPRDPASGQATGKRMHKPLVITKELDKSSPLLYQVLTQNENLTEWNLEFWRPQTDPRRGVGTETIAYTIKLTNANIASIELKMLNNRSTEFARYPELEEVTFTYEKIQWTWTDGGITATDDWLTSAL